MSKESDKFWDSVSENPDPKPYFDHVGTEEFRVLWEQYKKDNPFKPKGVYHFNRIGEKRD